MLIAHQTEQKSPPKKQLKRLPYQTPAIVHQGTITTRAGSPQLVSDPEESGVDPADLFSNGG